MAPGNRFRPRRYPNYPPAAPSPIFGIFGKQEQFPLPPQHIFRARRPLNDLAGLWLWRTVNAFDQLIHLGESQPSNGTVRKVYRPDGETHFAVAYGNVPDNELREMLMSIYAKHRDVTLTHDGRDSTGKHWIKCFSRVRPGSLEQPILKATICVSSKLEMATIPRPKAVSGKENGKVARDWSSVESWLEGVSLGNDTARAQASRRHWPSES